MLGLAIAMVMTMFVIIILCASHPLFFAFFIHILGGAVWGVTFAGFLYRWLIKLYQKRWIIVSYIAAYAIFFLGVVPYDYKKVLSFYYFGVLFLVGFLWHLIGFIFCNKKNKHSAKYFLIKIPIIEWLLYCPSFLFIYLISFMASNGA